MKQQPYYLCGSPDGWAIFALKQQQYADAVAQPLAHGLDTQGVLQGLKTFVNDETHRQGGVHVVIGVPASWCLCATISDAGIPRGSAAQMEQALRYRLEAALPITAEDCAIGLVGTQSDRLGIALASSRLRQLVQALEDEGYIVVSIAPRAFLAAQAWCEDIPIDIRDRPATLCWRERGVDESGTMQLLHINPAGPPCWRVLASPASDRLGRHGFAAQLMADRLSESAAERQWFTSDDLTEYVPFQNEDGVPAHALGEAIHAECSAARKVVQHPDQAWVNLATGPLAPRYQWRRIRTPALATTAAAILLLAAIVVIFLFRAQQYNQIAQQYDDQSAEAFAQAMPGQAVPVSPQRRLQTRLKQLRGESGMAGGEELQATATPAMNVLHDLLITLPSDQRYAITDLRLEDGGMRLSGYARSHGEADQLANALRKAGAFIVEPPSTDKLPDGGVRFSLTAQHNQPDIPADALPQAKPRDPDVPLAIAERTESEAGR